MKEVKLGRVAGPFDSIPYDTYMQSPIGLVPKAGGKTRLIFHLSYQFKQEPSGSLNMHTPREFCTVKYWDMDWAVKSFLDLIKNQTQPVTVVSGKTDVESAFRI